jgi:hypothetical protein
MNKTFSLDTHLLKQYIAAGSHKTSEEQLRLLGCNDSSKVRARVAENVMAPVDVLESLAVDFTPEVRAAVATNPRCPAFLLHALVHDPDPVVRHQLAQDIHTSPLALEQLKSDECAWVSAEAAKTLEILKTKKSQHQPHYLHLTEQAVAS